MAEYIEREAVVKLREEFWKDRCDYMAVRVTSIMNIPAADVVEVRHGRWEWSKPFGQYGYYCSLCKAGFVDSENAEWIAKSHDYCPHCGADMREVKEND